MHTFGIDIDLYVDFGVSIEGGLAVDPSVKIDLYGSAGTGQGIGIAPKYGMYQDWSALDCSFSSMSAGFIASFGEVRNASGEIVGNTVTFGTDAGINFTNGNGGLAGAGGGQECIRN